jgi:serine/threonine-protein kinase
MSTDAQDIAIARHVQQAGMATAEQVAAALQVQGQSIEKGEAIPLAEALVRVGAISPEQRKSVEHITRRQKTGIQQLSHYRLIRKLGEGGMGAVYLAEDVDGGRRVAVKVLPRHHTSNVEFIKRFRREAEAARRLEHPNIVRAFEAGEEFGYPFYAMEYCEGETLDRILKRQGLVAPSLAARVVLDAAKGLQYAHSQGFIHRDIKPANIFLTTDGAAKVLDLGLSKKIDDSGLSFQTLSGAMLGTPHYLSPEQARGDKAVDGRADIYSLGATLYHLLTGEPPFTGSTLYEILTKHVESVLPNPQDVAEDVPDGLVHVLRKMMAKRPEDRYPDCAGLVADLERVAQGREPKSQAVSVDASAVAVMRKQIQGARRRRAVTYRVPKTAKPAPTGMVVGGIIVALAAVLALIVMLHGGGGPQPVREPFRPPRVSTREDDARSELARILRFEGLKPDDIEGRIAKLDAFLRTNGDTHSATEARTQATQLRRVLADRSVDPATKPVDDAWIAGVRQLPPEEQVKRVSEKLKGLNPEWEVRVAPALRDGKVMGLTLLAVGITDLSPLRAFEHLQALDCCGHWQGWNSDQTTGSLSDLSPLRGMRLKLLNVSQTRVADLAPLRGMAFDWLNLRRTQVADLSPLEGSSIRGINLGSTPVTSIKPLKGMKLNHLYLGNTRVTDFSLLAEMPLRVLYLDFNPARDTALLRSLGTLESVNGTPIAEFWKKLEAPATEAGFSTRETLEIAFEDPPRMTGIQHRPRADGRIERATVAGRPCIKIVGVKDAMARTYFDVHDSWAGARGPVLVEIEYYDEGERPFDIEYDSWDETGANQGTFTYGGLVRPSDSKRWTSARILLLDARFRNRQYGDSDFRIEARADLHVSRVAVSCADAGRLPVTAAARARLSEGLAGWWKLDEGSGATVLNSAGGSQPGKLIDGPAWVRGQAGQALSFAGKGDHVSVPDFSFPPDASLTVAAFINHDDLRPAYQRYLTLGKESAILRYQEVGLNFYILTEGGHRAVRIPVRLRAGRWHHLAGSWDGAHLRIYLDGVMVSQEAPGGKLSRSPGLTLSSPSHEGMRGVIDDVRVYSRALSDEEIRALAGMGADVKEPPGSIDLLRLIDPKSDVVSGEWRFEGTGLVLSQTSAPQPRVQVPYAPPEEYDLVVIAERLAGSESLNLGISCRGYSSQVVIDGWPQDGFRSGLHYLDGREGRSNETTHKGRVLQNGKPSMIVCSVRFGMLTVSVDGMQVIDWKGNYSRLSMAKDWVVPDPKALWIGATSSPYRITRMWLMPVSGEGKRLR